MYVCMLARGVCVCRYVWVFVGVKTMSVFMYVCICVHEWICARVRARVCVCVCVRACVRACVFAVHYCLEDTVECVEDRDGVVIIDQYLCDKTLCVTFCSERKSWQTAATCPHWGTTLVCWTSSPPALRYVTSSLSSSFWRHRHRLLLVPSL